MELFFLVISVSLDFDEVNDPFESVAVTVHRDFNALSPVYILDNVGKMRNIVVFGHPVTVNKHLFVVLIASSFLDKNFDVIEIEGLPVLRPTFEHHILALQFNFRERSLLISVFSLRSILSNDSFLLDVNGRLADDSVMGSCS